MTMLEIIEKKKIGQALTREEIDMWIGGYVAGDIPDYQVTALLMAIFFQGMDSCETADLTMAMLESGETADLSEIPGIKVDKHSTGGVADTTTLILAPLAAACGVKVAKMSGRGLGHTGGTLDKLEAIPGMQVSLSMREMIDQIKRIGLAVVGQTADFAPADGLIYALRDVTGTVDSLPLIASSVMSKKLASGSDAIVLDVKAGEGAFMKDVAGATKLAREMVHIGKMAGRKTTALVTDMNQPLGKAIGNALEVREAIEILRGNDGSDLWTICLDLGAEMLRLAEVEDDRERAIEWLNGARESGAALRKFGEMIEAQGGDAGVIEDLTILPQAKIVYEAKAETEGYIHAVHPQEMGEIARGLGAGRMTKDDEIDLSTGLWIEARVGDVVKKGQVLCKIYAKDKKAAQWAHTQVLEAIEIGTNVPEKRPLIYEKIL